METFQNESGKKQGIGVISSLRTFSCHRACVREHIPEEGLAPLFKAPY